MGGGEAQATPTGSGGHVGSQKRSQGEWVSLRSHHAKLNAEGYVPPPPVEVPFRYAGYKRREAKGKKLTDGQVIALRTDGRSFGYTETGRQLGVSGKTIYNAVKGITFRHLNLEYPPLM